MGYTHYFQRPSKLDEAIFKLFMADCKKIVGYSQTQLGIAIDNDSNDKEVFFNGSEEQEIGVWTTSESIVLAFPSPMASIQETEADPIASKKDGSWFAGDMVSQRVAPINQKTGKGSGGYETFCIPLVREARDYEIGKKLLFDFCKTSYRPYDLPVTACLIAFKHHFKEAIKLGTDGEEKDWQDGRILCNNILGYGLTMELFDKE